MSDSLQRELLDLLEQSTGGIGIRKLLRVMPACNFGQLMNAVVSLEEVGAIEMDSGGLYSIKRSKPRQVFSGHCSYHAQRTKPGGVMTTEGHIPYARHLNGWLVPVRIDDDGRPIRKGGALVYVLPNGDDWQPESAEQIGRVMRGRA